MVFSIQSAMMIVRLWLPIADVRDYCVQASPFVGLLPASVGFAGLRFQGWTAAEGRLRLLSALSQAFPVPDNIAWGTLNRRGTRDGTQSVSRPYLTPYTKLERTRWGRGFARVSGLGIWRNLGRGETGFLGGSLVFAAP